MRHRSLPAAALVAACAVVASAAADVYRLQEGWGQLPAGDSWGEVTGVATTANNVIVAVRRSEPPILEFDPSGALLKSWGHGLFVWPHGFRIDKEGYLWITDGRAADGRGQQVFKIAPDGRIVMTLGTKGVGGETPETFAGPADVAFGQNGEIFVADGHQNSRVVKFTKDGKFIKAWGRRGAGQGEFNVPHAIATDSRGRVFVADRGNQRVQIFDAEGNYLDEWKQFGRPSGILITADDTLYVADAQNNERGVVYGSAKDGIVQGWISGTLPESVTLDRDGALYAGETTTGRILRKFVRQ
jgi:DNA-binding beta-propeller fold protein YncE